ncbi:MAG: insulinase family protein, partial [Planctomycetes bacterium]|nr:insulinase family protein [Planctomycetota bacterium]
IFSVAGKYDFDAVCKQIERLFDVETPGTDMTVTIGAAGDRYTHISHDGAQVHIGLMTQAPPIMSADYYDINVAVSILSGGMSSRLFTEVREKRGLCYAVGAKYGTLKDLASISCYAGTTPDKAQETLDVIIAEFGRLGEGISDGELQRAKVGLKSSLIMQSESSIARAGGIAGDYYHLGRVRSLDEIKEKLEATSVQSVLDCLRNNPFADYTVATIGPKKIDY